MGAILGWILIWIQMVPLGPRRIDRSLHPNLTLGAIPSRAHRQEDASGSLVITIRVALLDMRPMLRDMLANVVSHEQDMELIHCPAAPNAELAAARPDVMVCEIEDPLDLGAPSRLLQAVPRARVLMVAGTGEQAVVYELRPARKVLPNVSMTQVVEAIRFGLEQGDGTAQASAAPSVDH